MTIINVKGTIISNDYKDVYDWYGLESASPNDILETLPTDGSNIEVVINSPGGMVEAGSEIYTTLKDYKGNVTVKIVGMAASAASIVAMAGDKVLISPTAQMMIHNVSGGASGDYRSLKHEAGVLENYNKSIANAYAIKTGKSYEELLELMNNETYFTAQQAVENGFADSVMFENQEPKVASVSASILPMAVVDKARQAMKANVSDDKFINIKFDEQQMNNIVEKVKESIINKIENMETDEPKAKAKKHGFIF
ncbi:head maturation protease, ClpP-related [Rummeliibacillus suwonensis]|uniref:head maturation protease, ClpP-related n=1 Tax=Rummeliibacillus suwonensis TaxID=1306154 RepID=UPI0011B5EF93|nr:head maturation protease, ClpP-related [Rummeliibacillus suwonensis]